MEELMYEELIYDEIIEIIASWDYWVQDSEKHNPV